MEASPRGHVLEMRWTSVGGMERGGRLRSWASMPWGWLDGEEGVCSRGEGRKDGAQPYLCGGGWEALSHWRRARVPHGKFA